MAAATHNTWSEAAGAPTTAMDIDGGDDDGCLGGSPVVAAKGETSGAASLFAWDPVFCEWVPDNDGLGGGKQHGQRQRQDDGDDGDDGGLIDLLEAPASPFETRSARAAVSATEGGGTPVNLKRARCSAGSRRGRHLYRTSKPQAAYTAARKQCGLARQSAARNCRVQARRGLLKTAPGYVPANRSGGGGGGGGGGNNRVRFGPGTKNHDGLALRHRLLDDLVWRFFCGKVKTVEDVYDRVAAEDLHLLAAVYEAVGGLMDRAKSSPGGKAVHVLPGGGGRGSMIQYPTHNEALFYLREILRAAHNRLHKAAVAALSESTVDATKFVLHHARHPEQLCVRTATVSA